MLAIALWWIAITLLTVFRHAPEQLNSDVLLSSMMSLQNVTLFYWGQNRLLNILPFAAWPFRDPTANLWAILILPAFAFYGGLLAACHAMVARLAFPWSTARLFVLMSSVFLLVFTSYGIFRMAIWHVEYGVPVLMIALAYGPLWTFCGRSDRLWLAGAAVFFALAIGINPSSAILIAFIVCAGVLWRGRPTMRDFGAMGLAIVAFGVWSYIGHNPKMTYLGIMPGALFDGIARTAKSTLKTLDLYAILALFLAYCGVFFATRTSPPAPRRAVVGLRWLAALLALFSVLWLGFFSMNEWVVRNGHDWRYFTFLLIGWMMMASCIGALRLSRLPRMASDALLGAIAVAAIVVTAALPTPMRDFAVFKRVSELAPAPHRFYTGEYWDAWPLVIRDLMDGHESYGLTYRGQGNLDGTMAAVEAAIAENGYAEVACIGATLEHCRFQTERVIGPVTIEVAGGEEPLIDLRITLDQ